MTNDLYRTIRDAVQKAVEERGRLYEPAHEAHYIATHVFQVLALAGYAITKVPEDA